MNKFYYNYDDLKSMEKTGDPIIFKRRNEMTNEDITRIKEELAYLEVSDEQNEKNKFDSQLHVDVLKRVGFTNDQAIAIIGTILDAVCITTSLDANKSAKKMAHDLGMSIEEE